MSTNPKLEHLLSNELDDQDVPSHYWGTFVVFGLVLLALFSNMFLTRWVSQHDGHWSVILAGIVLLGFLITEIGALAFWFGIGPGRFSMRTLCTAFLAFLVCVSYTIGFLLPTRDLTSQITKIPLEIIKLLFTFGLGGFLALALPLLSFRWISGLSLQPKQAIWQAQQKPEAITISFLFLATTLVALTVYLLQGLSSSIDESSGFSSLPGWLWLLLVQHAVLSILLIVSIALWMLWPRITVFGFAAVFGTFIGAWLGGIELTKMYRPSAVNFEFSAMWLSYLCGLSVAVAMASGLARGFGLRLRKSSAGGWN